MNKAFSNTNAAALANRIQELAGLDADALSRATQISENRNAHLLETLFDLGAISAQHRAQITCETLDLLRFDEAMLPATPLLTDQLPLKFLRQAGALPLADDGTHLRMAMIDPFSEEAVQTLGVATLRKIEPVVADPDQLDRGFARLYEGEQAVPLAKGSAGPEIGSDLEEAAQAAPVIRMVKTIIDKAVRMQASDVHVEPFSDRLRLRYRVDGILIDMPPPPDDMARALTSRLKIMARLNIAERRLPQDGRFSHACDGREIDIRMSSIPTVAGESVVLRLLDKQGALLSFAQLGLPEQTRIRLETLLTHPTGIVLITGPTGSGKSTTLYAAMQQLNGSERKILSIEDPVEYQLSGVNQMAVRPNIGLDFATLLRSVLRQDPDIIMVGEMRDAETAEIATRAALTGHLVLSTVHTNTAMGAVTRLRDMGIPAFMITSTLRASVAQRLVRRVCEHCCEARDPTPSERAVFNRETVTVPAQIMQAKGCSACAMTGYRGRVGLYEVVELTSGLRSAIAAGQDEAALIEKARSEGAIGLVQDGLRKVAEGVTTVDELTRSLGAVVFDG